MSPSTRSPTSLPISSAEKTSWALNEALRPAYMVTMMSEVDATGLVTLRQRYSDAGVKAPSYTAIVLKMAALVMKKNPEANRAILGLPFFKRLYQFHNVDISVAVEKALPYLPGQAFAATVLSASDKSLTTISQELQQLVSDTPDTNPRLRTFFRILKLVPRPLSRWLINLPYLSPALWMEHRGCACWVNAPSKAGADLVFTTWPWPITFSFGRVKKRPFVVGDEVQARMTMPVVMVFDRRIMGGGPAGRLFAQATEILSSPGDYFGDDLEAAGLRAGE